MWKPEHRATADRRGLRWPRPSVLIKNRNFPERLLEYQTATSEVLGVISRWPDNLEPALNVIAAAAARVCDADDSHIYLFLDGAYRIAACINPDDQWVQRIKATPISPEMRGSVTARAAR